MNYAQLRLWEIRSVDCPFQEFIEEGDNYCCSFGEPDGKYEVVTEDHPQFAQWLADVKNIGFGNIFAKPIPKFDLPAFIPVVRRGSKKIMEGNAPPFVAVSIGDIVRGKSLSMPDEVRSRFGIHQNSKIILLCYGKDKLIEKMWACRKEIFSKIASLGFDLVTAVNYSVWFDQPHPERLINLKRSLVTFEEFQNLGLSAIPHIYWFGKKDLTRWADWLSKNKEVDYVAINLQTERERGNRVWEQTLGDLHFLVSKLERPIHFLITGPSRLGRIKRLQAILPKFSLTNGYCARMAASSFLISESSDGILYKYSDLPKNEIMRRDMTFYQNAMLANPY